MFEKRKTIELSVEKLKKISFDYDGDNEVMHIEADNILLELLIQLELNEVVEAYSNCSRKGFWYA